MFDPPKNLSGLDLLTGLTSLGFNLYEDIEYIPPLSSLSAVTKIDIDIYPNVSNPSLVDLTSWMSGMPAVETLNIHGGVVHAKIVKLPKLKTVTIEQMNMNQARMAVDAMKDLPALTTVTVQRCDYTTGLPHLEQLPPVRTLTVEGCENLIELSHLEHLSNLETLTI
ncbi:hypothetical protein CRD60_05640 [Bifidobacterium aemilianum]|uniref:Uncharacterized protein n=1 Tax=Bifidobacterium aemilianum TaxID=2493120 RepID=A0A366K7J5_9BIFI|nr:hypothetical protein [Bifidobacterium aemilianum]RBP97715.1 hypothetical protein CRD60_05640 [Bifidobacterium aemilianum]